MNWNWNIWKRTIYVKRKIICNEQEAGFIYWSGNRNSIWDIAFKQSFNDFSISILSVYTGRPLALVISERMDESHFLSFHTLQRCRLFD